MSHLDKRSPLMLRKLALATITAVLWQTAAMAQMSHHQHASEAASKFLSVVNSLLDDILTKL